MANTFMPPFNDHQFRVHEVQPAKVTPQSALITLNQAKEDAEEILKRRIYVNKALIDGYKALIPASIFVASVQGQVVASSPGSNFDNISVAANWFAFNGLVLDILGTAFGSMRLLSLQRSSRGAVRNQEHVDKAYTILKNEIDSMKAHSAPGSETSEAVKKLTHALGIYLEMTDDIYVLYYSSFPSLLDLTPVAFVVARGIINWAMTKSSFIESGVKGTKWLEVLLKIKPRRPRSTIPDQVPIIVMAFGIIFLLISVILRAVSTQFRRVWLGCIIITGIVCLYASPGIMHTDKGHPNHREREMKKKIEKINNCLEVESQEKD